MNKEIRLQSTITETAYPAERLEEFADNGEALELVDWDTQEKRLQPGNTIWERFREFFRFFEMDMCMSLGEGATPLIEADARLQEFTGIDQLWLKNDGMNPTWSFKDRGSMTITWLAKQMGEKWLATISTGNMAHSTAAYGSRARIGVIVFIPEFVSMQKIRPMSAHGANVIRIKGCDYNSMKREILGLANHMGLRITSGNNPFRVEGYKTLAFEIFEQLGNHIPDWIAVPTSACGHIRGIHKGFLEMRQAKLITELPCMIIIQPEKNSPIVSAIKQKFSRPIPFHNFQTVAEALSSGDPPGGEEIIKKANEFGWLAEDVSENEIIEGQEILAKSGFLVEAASSSSLWAIKKLRACGKIGKEQSVVLVLTGSGMKDARFGTASSLGVIDTTIERMAVALEMVLEQKKDVQEKLCTRESS